MFEVQSRSQCSSFDWLYGRFQQFKKQQELAENIFAITSYV